MENLSREEESRQRGMIEAEEVISQVTLIASLQTLQLSRKQETHAAPPAAQQVRAAYLSPPNPNVLKRLGLHAAYSDAPQAWQCEQEERTGVCTEQIARLQSLETKCRGELCSVMATLLAREALRWVAVGRGFWYWEWRGEVAGMVAQRNEECEQIRQAGHHEGTERERLIAEEYTARETAAGLLWETTEAVLFRAELPDLHRRSQNHILDEHRFLGRKTNELWSLTVLDSSLRQTTHDAVLTLEYTFAEFRQELCHIIARRNAKGRRITTHLNHQAARELIESRVLCFEDFLSTAFEYIVEERQGAQRIEGLMDAAKTAMCTQFVENVTTLQNVLKGTEMICREDLADMLSERTTAMRQYDVAVEVSQRRETHLMQHYDCLSSLSCTISSESSTREHIVTEYDAHMKTFHDTAATHKTAWHAFRLKREEHDRVSGAAIFLHYEACERCLLEDLTLHALQLLHTVEPLFRSTRCSNSATTYLTDGVTAATDASLLRLEGGLDDISFRYDNEVDGKQFASPRLLPATLPSLPVGYYEEFYCHVVYGDEEDDRTSIRHTESEHFCELFSMFCLGSQHLHKQIGGERLADRAKERQTLLQRTDDVSLALSLKAQRRILSYSNPPSAKPTDLINATLQTTGLFPPTLFIELVAEECFQRLYTEECGKSILTFLYDTSKRAEEVREQREAKRKLQAILIGGGADGTPEHTRRYEVAHYESRLHICTTLAIQDISTNGVPSLCEGATTFAQFRYNLWNKTARRSHSLPLRALPLPAFLKTPPAYDLLCQHQNLLCEADEAKMREYFVCAAFCILNGISKKMGELLQRDEMRQKRVFEAKRILQIQCLNEAKESCKRRRCIEEEEIEVRRSMLNMIHASHAFNTKQTQTRERLQRVEDTVRKNEVTGVISDTILLSHSEACQRAYLLHTEQIFRDNKLLVEHLHRFDKRRSVQTLLNESFFLSSCDVSLITGPTFSLNDTEKETRRRIEDSFFQSFRENISTISFFSATRATFLATTRADAERQMQRFLTNLPINLLIASEQKSRIFVDSLHSLRIDRSEGVHAFDITLFLRAIDLVSKEEDLRERLDIEMEFEVNRLSRYQGFIKTAQILRVEERRRRSAVLAEEDFNKRNVFLFPTIGELLQATVLPPHIRANLSLKKMIRERQDDELKASLEKHRRKKIAQKELISIELQRTNALAQMQRMDKRRGVDAQRGDSDSAEMAQGFCRLWNDLEAAVRQDQLMKSISVLSIPLLNEEEERRRQLTSREEGEYALLKLIRFEDWKMRVDYVHSATQFSSGIAMLQSLCKNEPKYRRVDVASVIAAHKEAKQHKTIFTPKELPKQESNRLLVVGMILSDEAVKRVALVKEYGKGLEDMNNTIKAASVEVRKRQVKREAASIRTKLHGFEVEATRRRRHHAKLFVSANFIQRVFRGWVVRQRIKQTQCVNDFITKNAQSLKKREEEKQRGKLRWLLRTEDVD